MTTNQSKALGLKPLPDEVFYEEEIEQLCEALGFYKNSFLRIIEIDANRLLTKECQWRESLGIMIRNCKSLDDVGDGYPLFVQLRDHLESCLPHIKGGWAEIRERWENE